MKEGKTFKRRFEKKYLVNADRWDNFVEQNQQPFIKNFISDHLHSATTFTLIENLYFDSYFLDSYQASVDKKEERYKLRIRRYFEEGVSAEQFYFEVKAKHNGQTFKERVDFRFPWLKDFIANGNYPLDELKRINQDRPVDEVLHTIGKISHFIHQQSYRPILKSKYKRVAYKVKGHKGVRLTIDENVHFQRKASSIQPQTEYMKYLSPKMKIIEIKYKDESQLNFFPPLLDFLGESCGFSKYCFGIYSTREEMVDEFRNIDQLDQLLST